MIKLFDDTQLRSLSIRKPRLIRGSHCSTHVAVLAADEMQLRQVGKQRPGIRRIERAGQGRKAVQFGPGLMVEISRHRHQARHIGASRRNQGRYRPAAGITDQHDLPGLEALLQLRHGLTCGLHHLFRETALRPPG